MTGGRAGAERARPALSAGGGEDPYYDLAEDWELVEASFQSMYGIRLSRELRGMKWREFTALVAGLDHKTPLGRVVSIRAEDDPARLKAYTPTMRRIRSEWRIRRARQMPRENVDAFLMSMKQAFLSLGGVQAAPPGDSTAREVRE